MDIHKLSKVPEEGSSVVASLSATSPHPFSSLALSPNRQYAVLSGKDVLQLVKVDPQGIKSLRTLKIAQYFQVPVNPPNRRSQVGRVYGDVRDTFANVGERGSRPRPGGGMIHGNVVVTCVAWSTATTQNNKGVEGGGGGHHELGDAASNKDNIDKSTESLIAAAGSNGIVAIWNAKQLLFADGTGGSSTLTDQPEAILSQHTRAVNSLAWHPRLPGLLLTASQDSTVKLWERMEVPTKPDSQDSNSRRSFRFFGKLARMQNLKSYTWSCRSTFEPKSEAVRDVQWSKFQDDIFAVVSVSGSLVVYSMHVAMRALVKVAAHTGDATTLDWHPTRPFVLATGGSGDRCVKVWDLEKCINMSEKDDSTPGSSILNNNSNNNNNTWNTTRSEFSSGGNSFSSSETDKSSGYSGPHAANLSIHGARALSGGLQGSTLRIKSSAAAILHVLSTVSSVTKLKWRPPANLCIPSSGDGGGDDGEVDRHDSMLAVASARLTSAGGSGALSLWSFNRPYMALSVVEGHKEGAVADFVWLETPQPSLRSRKISRTSPSELSLSTSRHDSRRIIKKQMAPAQEDAILIRSSGRNEVDSILFDSKDRDGDDDRGLLSSSIWQHILSVGRDGQCLLQSLVRGERPIYRVPPSCFAMANLSPFQSGYGSLQCFSVYQNVPRMDQDYQLSGLRQDEVTALAPGVFREIPPQDSDASNIPCEDSWISGRRLPATPPDMIFNVIDQGNLKKNGLPLENDDGAMCIAPEVVHLSRFADMYKLYPDERVPTRVGLCLHNSEVAEKLRCAPLSRMWRSIASMLAGAGMDELHSKKPSIHTKNVMQFAIFPTIKSLLEERATSGDVQTCVAVCEVLQVIQSDGGQTIIPGLELNLVREWYLSYIDILQQMCLFSAASSLIRSCKDPFIGALNQQSTTFHESCPRCGKPLPNEGAASLTSSARRVCMNCRHPVGLCFVCHQPVKGMFVWCPGCGHGGHLVCALQWFGGINGTPVREVCPTGCGHRCNFTQTLSAFPRTDSMTCLPVTDVAEMVPR